VIVGDEILSGLRLLVLCAFLMGAAVACLLWAVVHFLVP
jgi:hypothetical protein